MTAYLAPLGEVQSICGSDDVLGCYGGQRLVSLGDSSGGMPPASIAAHEYGHHVANNRSNAPGRRSTGGRSAGHLHAHLLQGQRGHGVSRRRGPQHTLNPGEGFAESYRVLVETNGSAEGYDWPVVATPLGGDLRVDVGSAAGLTLRSVDGRQILARGAWNGTGGRSATDRICGARTLQVRLNRNGAAARFALRITIP